MEGRICHLILFRGLQSRQNVQFFQPLSFKNEFQTSRELGPCDRIFTVYPLELFRPIQISRNAKLLLTLHSSNIESILAAEVYLNELS